MEGAGLGAHQAAFVERSLALRTAIGIEGGIPYIGSRVSRRKDKHMETVVEMLYAESVEKTADGIFRAAVARAGRAE